MPAETQTPTVTPLAEGDHAEWREMWRRYLDFYETPLPEDVYAETWRRLMTGGPYELRGLIARAPEGAALGLAHFVAHRTSWALGDVLYLEDLFVEPSARGGGVGRALIEAIYAEADAGGASRVYWLTRDSNHTARRLYDRLAELTPFVQYERS